MIEPSRIFPKEDRELRRLTRAREGYVTDMTREKNRIHHALESCGIKLSSVLADVFGKSGRYLLNSLLDGVELEEMIKGIPVKSIRKKARLLSRLSRISPPARPSGAKTLIPVPTCSRERYPPPGPGARRARHHCG